jgi:hypothetical protein
VGFHLDLKFEKVKDYANCDSMQDTQQLETKVSSARNPLRYFAPIFLLFTALNWQSQASAGQLQLTWSDNSNNEDGFKIERKTGQREHILRLLLWELT